MNTNYIPGIEKNGKQLSSMNEAVVAFRANPDTDAKAHYYDWNTIPRGPPIVARHPLKHFQDEGIQVAKRIMKREMNRGVIIADDKGLGKTIEALVLIQEMALQRVLYVVPANTLKQWNVQHFKWTGRALHHIKTKKEAAACNNSVTPECIMTYELLDSLRKESIRWQAIVYDEIHKLRGRSTKMSLAARELRDSCSDYIIGLTGSLQWGYTRDLWNPLRCVFGYKFGSADEFDFTYCGAYYNEHGGKVNIGHLSRDGVDRSAELDIRLSYVSIARTRREVAAELPAFQRKVVRVPATQKATIALHAFLRKELPYMNAIMSTTSEKTEYVLEALEGLRNAVIFTWTKADVANLAALIAKTGKEVQCITGATSKQERYDIIQNAAKTKATIVATIDAAGVGVDGLQHVSSDMMFHSLSHSPNLHLQAEARLMRIGQKNPVTITYFVMRDSADELVIKVMADKVSQDGTTSGEDGNSMASELKFDNAGMQSVLDEWIKNATDELAGEGSNSDGWSDAEDDEY